MRPRGNPLSDLEATRTDLEIGNELSLQVASRSHVRDALRSQGTNFETKIFNFRCFFGPSDQNELYHTLLLFKV